MCSLRRKYVQLYLEWLQLKSKTENSQIREIEEEVDTEVLLLWRYANLSVVIHFFMCSCLIQSGDWSSI